MPDPRDGGVGPVSRDAVLEADGVQVRLGGRMVVDGVSLSVAPSEVLAVVGPNGSGKSSLVRALFGALPRTGGTVRLDGRPIEQWSRGDIARRIAVVAQESPAELPLRVDEVVLLGRLPWRSSFARWTEADRAAADRALALTDTAHLARRIAWSLSGGERQRILIARALAQGSPLMLWDEPTNHLDLRHAHDGLALLRDLGLTGVVVLHDLNLAARYADRALLLVDGRSVAIGPVQDVLTPPLVRAAFGIGATAVHHLGTPQLLFARDPDGAGSDGITAW